MRTVMSETNKNTFKTQIELQARSILDKCDKNHTNVHKLESTMNQFIDKVKDIHKANSRTYEIKIKPKGLISKDKRVKLQIKERELTDGVQTNTQGRYEIKKMQDSKASTRQFERRFSGVKWIALLRMKTWQS